MNMPKMKLPLKLLVPLLIIALFAAYSFATSVNVTTSTVQSENGVLFNVSGGFTAVSNGFSVVQSTAVASAQPATWTPSGTVQTALTAGHWYYSVTLTLAASATASTTYTVTVTWNTGTGYTTLGTLQVTTLATITAAQTMTFYIDTGLTTFNAPTALTVTVA
jgi:hypothetical protein